MDPFLRTIVTRDPAASRFHACERFERCAYAGGAGADVRTRVVYVNPVTMDCTRWTLYLQETRARLACGEVVDNLVSLFLLSRLSFYCFYLWMCLFVSFCAWLGDVPVIHTLLSRLLPPFPFCGYFHTVS